LASLGGTGMTTELERLCFFRGAYRTVRRHRGHRTGWPDAIPRRRCCGSPGHRGGGGWPGLRPRPRSSARRGRHPLSTGVRSRSLRGRIVTNQATAALRAGRRKAPRLPRLSRPGRSTRLADHYAEGRGEERELVLRTTYQGDQLRGDTYCAGKVRRVGGAAAPIRTFRRAGWRYTGAG
jgi:hypothetical protein